MGRLRSAINRLALFWQLRPQGGMPTLLGGLQWSGCHVFTSVQSPAGIVLNTTAEQSLVVAALPFNLPLPVGALVFVFVDKPTAQAGLGIVGARVIDNTHIGVTFSNNTGATINPTAAEAYTFVVIWFLP